MKPTQAVTFAGLEARLPPAAPPGTMPSPPDGVASPVLPLIAGEPALAYYASLAMLRGAPPPPALASPAPSSPAPALVAANAPASPPPASPPLGASAPPAASAPPPPPPTPVTLASAPRYEAPPVSLRPAPHPAARPLIRTVSAPVIATALGGASALGGAYPNLPPPAPLSGTH